MRKLYILLFGTIACSAGFCWGYDSQVYQMAEPVFQAWFRLDGRGLQWLNSAFLLGSLVGALLAGQAGNMWGRVNTLVGAALFWMGGSLAMGWADSFLALGFFRGMMGVGAGAAVLTGIIYLAEIAPPARRGGMVAAFMVAFMLGRLFAWLLYGWATQLEPESWRWMIGGIAIPLLISGVASWFLPESPRWLARQGRSYDAERVLDMLMGLQSAQWVLYEIKQGQAWISANAPGDLFRGRLAGISRWGIVLALTVPLSGLTAIWYFFPKTLEWRTLGAAYMWLPLVIMLAGVGLAMYLSDKWGRKKLLVFSLGGMALLGGLIGLLWFEHGYTSPWVLVAFSSYLFLYAAGPGTLFFVLIAELFPNQVRGLGTSFILALSFLFALAMTWAFPVLHQRWSDGGIYLFFAGTNLVLMSYCWNTLPETGKRSLEKLTERLIFPAKTRIHLRKQAPEKVSNEAVSKAVATRNP